MSALELKIPPVLVAAIIAALIWITSALTPEIPIPLALKKTAMYLFPATGALIGIAAVLSFRRARTTLNPLQPDNCSALVDSGIFKFTRNPMYLALLLALLGWGFMLGSIYSLAWAPVFVCYMNRFQIQPEERALEKRFGAGFSVYKKQVRRWI